MGDKLEQIDFLTIETKSRLEQVLTKDISIVDSNLLMIGRQVPTSYGKFIDPLAMDADRNLVVIELKRNDLNPES